MGSESRLIERFFSRHRDRIPVGVGDDAAIVKPRPGRSIVMTVDTSVEGVHFPSDIAPFDIGYRTLAVNLSDLAAMAATPRWALLSLSCPNADEQWMDNFAEGFYTLAERFNVVLAGGDLVRAPLSVSVTVLGEIDADSKLLRSGANAGDHLFVTGSPGAAATGLDSLQNKRGRQEYEKKFLRPQPRVAEGLDLANLAGCAIDISDGLLSDARQLALASGADIEINAKALRAIDAEISIEAALAGGDDYELLFSIAPSRLRQFSRVADEWSCGYTLIGAVVAGDGDVSVPGVSTDKLSGYDHFSQ